MSDDLQHFQERIGYHFRDTGLLERALTHPSLLADGSGWHNQRLEFLGDSVLALVLAEQLFKLFPGEREGHLARARSALAKGEHLAAIARELGLHEVLRLSEQEEKAGGRERISSLEDALEAVVAAIYLDSDFQTARRTVLPWYGDVKARTEELLSDDNPKGRLQEHIQRENPDTPIEYDLVHAEGPDHSKTFIMELRIGGRVFGMGRGRSKKDAEENAAREALQKLVKTPAEPVS
ncbi:ribonuclease III [Ruficoccus amylovorans]|uniref:Ribonuclease 3 n=1 Tax=Ruficoccus amylovorans TaxID=1804625 RepID=A0A842HFB1_9BACT|nr:ribonuclease III [Ruficoccus amylovorans]MBC2594257.1 ribonuclease III [Ruficoccus amylovorans]